MSPREKLAPRSNNFFCCHQIKLWSAECGQVNQQQHMFAGQSPCAKTLNQADFLNSHDHVVLKCEAN